MFRKSLFYPADKLGVATPVVEFAGTYAVDCSGSTSGQILSDEKASVKKFQRVIKPHKVYSWGSICQTLAAIDQIVCAGGTSPQTIVPKLSSDGCDFLLLYTDGCIGASDMEFFRSQMKQLPSPVSAVVVVMTLARRYTTESTIQAIRSQVNASIAEACLSIADHALVLIQLGDLHMTLMSSGSFAAVCPAVGLTNDTKLADLPKFEPNMLSDVLLKSLPPGTFQLDGFDSPLVLESLLGLRRKSVDALSAMLQEDDDNVAVLNKVLQLLNQRVLLPRLDLVQMHELLVRVSKSAALDKRAVQLEAMRQKLAAIGTSDRSGSEEHRALLKEFQALRKRKATPAQGDDNDATATVTTSSTNVDMATLRTTTHDFLNTIAAYEQDKTSLVLGSNRANRAKEVSKDELADLGDCMQIDECPIYLTNGDACILLKMPQMSLSDMARNETDAKKDNKPAKNANVADPSVGESPPAQGKGFSKDAPAPAAPVANPVDSLLFDGQSLFQYCTSDYFMEAPFCFGTFLSQTLTPGLYCYEFGVEVSVHPLTREPLLGALPLCKDPLKLLQHLSCLFAAKKELWHLIRGYVAMVAQHLATKQWAESETLREHVEYILKNYISNENLKGADEDVKKVPFGDAIKHVVKKFELLRDRAPEDITALATIVDVFYPDFEYNRVAVAALSQFMSTFGRLLAEHKRQQDMTQYVMEFDEYGHFVSLKKDLPALVARLFLVNDDSVYRGKKLQDAVDQALLDPTCGESIRRTLKEGKVPPEAFDFLQIVEPPSDNPHFGNEAHGEWQASGRPADQCMYCGLRGTELEMAAHFKEAFGDFFFPGQRAVILALEACASMKRDEITEKLLFQKAKAILQKRLGAMNPLLHSQYLKRRVLHFIGKLMKARGLA